MTYWYDDLGRLKRVMDQQGNIRTYNYDAVGNILSIVAGDGGCPAIAPGVAVVTPASCKAGSACRITITGSSLMGGAVTTSDIRGALTHCREEDCGRISCLFTPDPFLPPGPITISVSTPLGTTQQTIEVGEPAQVQTGGGEDVWHFVANIGQVVTIRMTRIVNRQDGSSTLDPIVELRDSRGFLIAQDDDSGSDLPSGPGRNAVIQNFTLPATDTFHVVARGKAGTSGRYILEIEPSSIALLPGPAEPAQSPAFVFQGTISAQAEADFFTFPADRGQFATISVNRVANNPDGSGTLDAQVELRDSRGFLLGRDDDSGTNQPPGPGRNAAMSRIFLPATDAYSLKVRGTNATVGPYRVEVFLEN